MTLQYEIICISSRKGREKTDSQQLILTSFLKIAFSPWPTQTLGMIAETFEKVYNWEMETNSYCYNEVCTCIILSILYSKHIEYKYILNK